MKRMLFLILLCLPFILSDCKNSSNTGSVGTPKISSMTPAQVLPGQSNIEGHILGSSLAGVIWVDLGAGVQVINVSGISDSDVYVFFSVSRSVATGQRTIQLATGAGVATSSNAFTIGDNVLPVARYTVSPGMGYKATVFRFDASSSYDPNGSIVNYHWSFGDGSSTNGKVVSHQFHRDGSMQTMLTVTDNQNGTDQYSRFIDVAASRSPIAVFTVTPPSGDTTTDFHFDGSASHDPDGHIVRYSWSFSDGNTASGPVVNHQYSTGSDYSVFLSVQDNTGVSSQATRLVRVDQAPSDGGGGGGGGGDGGGGGGGGGGGTCSGSCEGYSHTQPFGVAAVNGDTITSDTDLCMCSKGCGEVRRPNTSGSKEFLGDLVSMNGRDLTLDHHLLTNYTPAQVGESVYLVFKPCP